MCGQIQLVFQILQIPKDIEGNEVQISSATSMLGRQLEDMEKSLRPLMTQHRHAVGILLKPVCSLKRTHVYWKTIEQTYLYHSLSYI